MTANEDFLFAQEAVARGFVTTAQVEEALLLQKRMAEELKIDERVGVILVKRGWLAEDQARRIQARVAPPKGDPGQIRGYRLLEIVGRGAMGTVYRAIHLGLNKPVAIKILRQDLAGDRTQVERLKAEAAMLASLDHPNVVRALDAGESNGFPYFVMELVDGETLRDRMRRDGPLPEKDALEIARGIADALERARRMGVVHRDVKPGNILLTRTGVPKLMDLGLAKGPVDLGLTQHGSTVGTPQYIAPEQAVDPRAADTRSDIYALGATLYAMLAGRPPFDGATLAEILTKVLYEAPQPLRSIRPEVSPEAGYLVERMMLRDPSLRYRTPALVVADIDRLIGGQSILPSGFSGNWEAFLLKRRWRRLAVVVPAGLAVSAAVVLGGRWWSGREERDAEKARVEAALAAAVPLLIPPTDGRADVERRLAEVRALLDAARRTGAASVADIEGRERAFRAELDRFDALERAEREVEPSVASNRFRDADEVLGKVARRLAGDGGSGPARRLADERLARLRARSDERLAEERRLRFSVPPRDALELVSLVDGWRKILDDRFAPTPTHGAELARARDGTDAARELADALGKGLGTLTDDAIRARIGAFELARLRRDVTAARAAVEAVREPSARQHLVVPRYVLAGPLDALATEPLAARERVVEATVYDAWTRARAEAAARVEGGDVRGAARVFTRWETAGAEGEAFPDVAAAARAAGGELDSRLLAAANAAEAAAKALSAEIAVALAGRDAAALRGAVARASGSAEVLAPLDGALASFEAIPAAWDRAYERALEGIERRIGQAEDRWIDALVFLGASAAERKLEVRAIDRVRRTFTVVSHSGGFPKPPQTRAVTDLSTDDLARLGGLDPASAADALSLALHAFPALVGAETDPFAALEAHTLVVERMSRANALETPLGIHVRARRTEIQAEVDRLEREAATALRTAEARINQGRSSGANPFLKDLLDGPFRGTRLVRENRDRIAAMATRVLADTNRDVVVLALNGAEVERRGAADALDVTVRWSFDTPEQGRSFLSGWARFVPSASGRRVVTPDPTVRDLSLLLHPDSVAETVRDRVLAMRSIFDPSADTTVAFEYWPLDPFFLGIDVDGVQVGVLSADPHVAPFPKDVPKLDGKEEPPRFAHYGLGRGVRHHVGPEFGDPAKWGWGEEFQGRAFSPPGVSRRTKEGLSTRYFAFETRDRPYRVRVVKLSGRGVRLEVDDVVVYEDAGAEFRAIRPSGKIQILTYTPCRIDDLSISGRLSAPWFEKVKREFEEGPGRGTKPR